jgi:hypothetical protein
LASRLVLAKQRLACENSRFSVFLDEITCQEWPTILDYLVVAPKQLANNLVAGVAVLPIIDEKIGLCYVFTGMRPMLSLGDSQRVHRGR